ncbi:MAG: hypothetical protein NT088_02905 [Candidatus Omnitrophica bacterium]|nr:hypothetical protein [Candidatus Omnitrophota bacterium]
MNIKRLIAREGLVLVGIVAAGAFLTFLGSCLENSIAHKYKIPYEDVVWDDDLEKIKANISKMDAIGVSANEIDKYLLSEGLTLKEANKLCLRPKRDYYKEEIQGKQPQVDLSSYSDEELMKIVGFSQKEQEALKELRVIREKYPEYKDLDDVTLVSKLGQRFPQYQSVSQVITSITHPAIVRKKTNISTKIIASITPKMGSLGVFILILGYPLYLLFRFILWAKRTLKAGA